MAEDYIPVDSEQLIYEVEKRPLLYDVSFPDYNDRGKKFKCWEEVCETAFANWSELTNAERNNRGKYVWFGVAAISFKPLACELRCERSVTIEVV